MLKKQAKTHLQQCRISNFDPGQPLTGEGRGRQEILARQGRGEEGREERDMCVQPPPEGKSCLRPYNT